MAPSAVPQRVSEAPHTLRPGTQKQANISPEVAANMPSGEAAEPPVHCALVFGGLREAATRCSRMGSCFIARKPRPPPVPQLPSGPLSFEQAAHYKDLDRLHELLSQDDDDVFVKHDDSLILTPGQKYVHPRQENNVEMDYRRRGAKAFRSRSFDDCIRLLTNYKKRLGKDAHPVPILRLSFALYHQKQYDLAQERAEEISDDCGLARSLYEMARSMQQ